MDDTRYLSRPQALVQTVQAATTVAILPRGGGKSSNIAPYWFMHRVKLMPRGASAIIGSTYKQLLSRTLPPFITTLRQMGYVDGVHFVINKRPPKQWEAEPEVKPETYDGVISWVNGHETYLVSQDRPGSPNSLSVQFHLIDEGRYLNKPRYDDDAAPTLRGLEQLYGQLPEYLSTLIMTDQPTSASGRWLFDYEQYHDEKLNQILVNLYCMMLEHQQEMQSEDVKPTRKEQLRHSYNNLKQMYDAMRKDAVLFIEGTLEDTVQILGKDAIEKMKRSMHHNRFLVSIAGKRTKQMLGTFYPDLDEDTLTYPEKINYSYYNSIDILGGQEPDWRQDADLDVSLPLRIGSDHGARYNGFAIGQFNGRKLRVVNNMWVIEPEVNMDLVHKFIKYYKGYPTPVVIFYYDHTHIAISGKAENITFVDEVTEELTKHGWEVHKVFIGHTPSPTDRFKLSSNCFRGKAGYVRVEFNREKTEVLRDSMHDTMAIPGRKENTIVKDKRPEKDRNLSQELAPHGGDSFDILLWGVSNPNNTQIEQSSSLPPMVSSTR